MDELKKCAGEGGRENKRKSYSKMSGKKKNSSTQKNPADFAKWCDQPPHSAQATFSASGKRLVWCDRGLRNDNGQALVEWANMHHLVLANTLFRYSMRYRTTSTGCMASPDGLRKMIHNMIDYIVIPKRYTPLVVRARSYARTETFSDHKK